MILELMKEQFAKLAGFASSTTSVCSFVAAIVTCILAYFKVLSTQLCIPLWVFILSVIFPFTCWWFIRHRLSIKNRKYKTADIVKIIGDSRPFIVFTYYTWYPSYLKVKEKDGDCMFAVNQKYVSEYTDYEDDSTRFSFLPPAYLPPKIKNKDIPVVAVKIKKL